MGHSHSIPDGSESENSEDLYIAVYDYFSDFNDEHNQFLNVKKGTELEILDKSNRDLWLARIYRTDIKGFIPYNYVTHINSLEAQPWYFKDTKRSDAIRILMNADNPIGTYLVRPSESGQTAISLKIFDKNKQKLAINHYIIQTVESNGSMFYFIGNGSKYPSINKLIQRYTKHKKLKHKLKQACPIIEPIYSLAPEFGKNWEIDRQDITLNRVLGEGTYGVVYKGLWRYRKLVAVKELKTCNSMSREEFLAEASIMKNLHHRNLVKLYAICSKVDPIYIIQEYVLNGCLRNYLTENRKMKSFETLKDISAQIAFGMSYIESQNLIHRDLAARNVLLGENDVPKICDFGLARIAPAEYVSRRSDVRLPIRWMATESLKELRFSIKSDVWAFGVLLMEVFTFGEQPYKHIRNCADVERYVKSGRRMTNPPEYQIPNDLFDIMIQCWSEEPERRPTFEFLSHYLKTTAICEPSYSDFSMSL